MNKAMRAYIITITLIMALLSIILVACFPPQPHNILNICAIFKQYPTWYWDGKRTEVKWGVPLTVQMAIIYQESGFRSTAEPPPKKRFLNVPATTALGYCQALNGTWQCYQKAVRSSKTNRDEFASASDFIGWYAHMAQRLAGVKPTDPYNLYLAYHEGIGGYREHSYLRKPWLIQVAHRVEEHAFTYYSQLKACEDLIPKPSLYQPGR